jgi:hypothetical protein
MASKLPYLASPGLITKILAKIQEARKPERFTQDFLGTKLGFTGGSAMAVIPLLKRMGFVNSDGSPAQLYDRFRNIDSQAAATAFGIRNAYSELFERNQYAGDLPKEKLKALVMEVTGAAHDDRTVELTVSTFLKLKELADFEAKPDTSIETTALTKIPNTNQVPSPKSEERGLAKDEEVGLNLAYTINLVLPETTNPDVFNTIFRSLKENLLKK